MNVVCVGAHPDDVELLAGGTCVKWIREGFKVLVVSATNGDIGHYEMAGGILASRRVAESAEAARRGKVDHVVLDNHDGELMPTLELRRTLVRIIRECKADLVLTHRPNDYHPDHRYTSLAVQDSAYMVTVPNFCPDVPALRKNPVYMYMMDRFTKPYPFNADVAVAVDDVMDVKWDMLDAMESQVYEWLPWHDGVLDEVPKTGKGRKAWLEKAWGRHFKERSKAHWACMERWYGKKGAAKVEFGEFFEVSEYGGQPNNKELRDLFPFLPKAKR